MTRRDFYIGWSGFWCGVLLFSGLYMVLDRKPKVPPATHPSSKVSEPEPDVTTYGEVTARYYRYRGDGNIDYECAARLDNLSATSGPISDADRLKPIWAVARYTYYDSGLLKRRDWINPKFDSPCRGVLVK